MELPADLQPSIDETPLTPLGQRLLREHGKPQPKPVAEEPVATRLPSSVLLWLVVPLFLLDLLMGPVSLLESASRGDDVATCVAAVIVGGWVGLIAAQVTLWNMSFVFSPESRWRRLRFLAPQVILCGVAALLGFAFADWSEQWNTDERTWWENSMRFYCLMPLIALAGQAPFFACWFFGWGIQKTNSQASALPAEVPPKSLSIADLLWATAAVAVAFGLVRAAPTSTLYQPQEIWELAGVFSAIAGGFSLLGGVTLIVLLHFVRHPLFRIAWIVGLLFAAWLVTCIVYGYSVSWDQVWRDGPFFTLLYGMVILAFLAGLAACLRLLRWQGWKVAPRT